MKIIKFLTTFAIIFTGVFSTMMLGAEISLGNSLGWLWIIPSQLVVAPAYVYYKGVI